MSRLWSAVPIKPLAFKKVSGVLPVSSREWKIAREETGLAFAPHYGSEKAGENSGARCEGIKNQKPSKRV
jgi:hypothetical protein